MVKKGSSDGHRQLEDSLAVRNSWEKSLALFLLNMCPYNNIISHFDHSNVFRILD